jgi:hypothetical protein
MGTDVARLLARGGRVLGLASLAYARGQRSGQGPWYVLPPEMVAATEEIIGALERGAEAGALAAAVGLAMGPEPATAAPAWAGALVENTDALEALGRGIGRADLDPALPRAEGGTRLDDRSAGLAAVAIAFCRSVDVVEDLCRVLGLAEGSSLRRMSRLANAVVVPGQPTRMRRAIRRQLEGGG